jgi:hypothetical protein
MLIACKADVLAPESILAFIVGIFICGKLHHSTLPIIILPEFICIPIILLNMFCVSCSFENALN